MEEDGGRTRRTDHVRDSPLLSALSSLSLTSMEAPQTLQTSTPQTSTPQTSTPQTSTPQTSTLQTSTLQTSTPQTWARQLPAVPSPGRAAAPGGSRDPPVDLLVDPEASRRRIAAGGGGEAAGGGGGEGGGGGGEAAGGGGEAAGGGGGAGGGGEAAGGGGGGGGEAGGGGGGEAGGGGGAAGGGGEAGGGGGGEAGGPKATPVQDLYVLMDSITENEKQRSSTSSSEEQREGKPQDVAFGGGEYVKFSREKFWLEPPPEELRKELEEELKLSGTDPKSHAWYHGGIPWKVSESLVVNHGDFLIRDSQSSSGDFVLTSRWEQKTFHFPVKKTAVRSSETFTRVQFSLETEAFDSLPALVHFYVGGRETLTRWSGAQIQQPVNRTLPLSYLETAFRTAGGPPAGHQGAPDGSESGEEPVCPRSPSSLHHQGADVDQNPAESSVSPPTPQSRSPPSSRSTSVAPSPSPSRRSDTGRPLPSPSSTVHRQQLDGSDQDSSSDLDGSCYTELYPGPQSYVERLRAEEGTSPGVEPLRAENGNVYSCPVVETVSCFRPGRYQSALMPKENKPLEVGILRRVKELLAEVDPRTAAKHITKADCVVARILEVTPEVQRMMGVSSGMELLTLPHGQQLRLDLLERFQTMSIVLAVDVLGCTGSNEERAGLLHRIIQIAAELKSTMGNMFGFAAVMRALELPQVSRLEQTWTALRQRHTDAAILYEKTLRPFMKSLNDGRESCPLSNTTFPHVLPLLSLLEKTSALGDGPEPWEPVEVGVDVVMFHLGAARTVAQLGGIYRSNTETKLQGFQEQPDVLEIFQTDFQLRLLWGSRGAEENQALRFSKFHQVLTALSNKLEPPARRV